MRRIVDKAGFTDVALTAAAAPVRLGADAKHAYEMVSTQGLAREVLDGLDGGARAHALDRLRALLADHETPDGVLFGSSCWVITALRL